MKKKPNDFSLIDTGLNVEGTVRCKGKLIVKGTLKGQVDVDDIVIAEGGSVHAELKAKTVSIGGEFEGTIKETGELTILSTGNCTGHVNCGVLALEPGGILNGEIICTGKPPEK